MKIMRSCGWILTASLWLSLSAAAQQSPGPATAGQPSGVQPVSTTTPGIALAAKTPASVDQVVDRFIEREHALITFLKNRTPLVETYLQNLSPDTKLGAAPKEDHYFLG